MTHEPNMQVLALWQEQTDFLTQVPAFVERYTTDIGGHLGMLYQAAEQAGNQELMLHINATWEQVGGLKTVIDNQQLVATNAGVILTALKVQCDELAAELQHILTALGQQPTQGTLMTDFLERLYDDWLETVDTSEAESDAQDELLQCIEEDIVGTWDVPDSLPTVRILSAIRGHLQLDQSQASLFQAFLNSLGGG